MSYKDRKAFTLVELLVVIAIIAVLAGFLLPALQRVRNNARITKCTNNLRQFSSAVDIYRGNLDVFPDYLSNLYSAIIDTKETYLCPSDRSNPAGSEGGKPPHEPHALQYSETDDNLNNLTYARMRNTEIQYCSYLYEFCGAPCSWINPNPNNITWKEAKIAEMEEGTNDADGNWIKVYGHVPIVRCFWHIKPVGTSYEDKKMVINVAVENRNIFKSGSGAHDWKVQDQ